MASDAKRPTIQWEVLGAEFKSDRIVAYEIRMPRAEISRAHADLVEAAPALLEACKAAMPYLAVKAEKYPNGNAETILHGIKLAVALAEGKQPHE